MSDFVMVNAAKRRTLGARAGMQSLSPIKGVAFGNGAVNDSGEVISPSAEETSLKNELFRKDMRSFAAISDFCIRYTCVLEANELAGERINEVALIDSDGDIVAVKAFSSKEKDGDTVMVLDIDDIFEEE